MAEENAAAEEESEDAKKGGGLVMGLIVPLLLVVLVAAGAGAGLAFMLAPQFGTGAGEKHAAGETDTGQDAAGAEAGGHGAGERKKAEGEGSAHDGAAERARQRLALYHGKGELVRLRPVTTNLRKPFNAWVRLEGALIIVRDGLGAATEGGEAEASAGKGEGEKKAEGGKDAAPTPEGGIAPLMALVEEEVHSYLRTLSLKDLEGAANLAFLRDDLTERAATRTGGLAKEFVVLSLVVEE